MFSPPSFLDSHSVLGRAEVSARLPFLTSKLYDWTKFARNFRKRLTVWGGIETLPPLFIAARKESKNGFAHFLAAWMLTLFNRKLSTHISDFMPARFDAFYFSFKTHYSSPAMNTAWQRHTEIVQKQKRKPLIPFQARKASSGRPFNQS